MSTDHAKLDLDALEAAEGKATPGPWTIPILEETLIRSKDRDVALTCCNVHGYDEDYATMFDDAGFIAAIRNAAPALIAKAREAERLQADLECRAFERDVAEHNLNEICEIIGVEDDADDAPGKVRGIVDDLAAAQARIDELVNDREAKAKEIEELQSFRDVVAASRNCADGWITEANSLRANRDDILELLRDAADSLTETIALATRNEEDDFSDRARAILAKIEAALKYPANHQQRIPPTSADFP